MTNFKHGHCVNDKSTKTYVAWAAMRDRCNNPKRKGYENWGGRGITVCERWNKFENFLADIGEAPKGLTIDRIDNDGNYEPGNCRWATWKEQARNKQPHEGFKLNPLKVQVIKKLLLKNSLKQGEIAEIFEVGQPLIAFINTNRRWKDI